MSEQRKQSNAAMNKETARKFYERIAGKQYDKLFDVSENSVWSEAVNCRQTI